MRVKIIVLSLILFVMVFFGCPDDKKSTNPVTDHSTVSKEIDTRGGTIIHPDGVQLDIEEATFTSSVQIKVKALTDKEVASLLPTGMERLSTAFSIDIGENTPNIPIKITFPLSEADKQRDPGTQGIYRYDGETTTFVGAITTEDKIYTFMKKFSITYHGYGDPYVMKKFCFWNDGPNDAWVSVINYKPIYPDITLTPSDAGGAWPSYAAPEGDQMENRGWFPIGSYQFCAQWVDPVFGKRYRIVGGYPPNWTYFLHERILLDAPLIVHVDTTFPRSTEGDCPCNYAILTGTWAGAIPHWGGTQTFYITEETWTQILSETNVIVMPIAYSDYLNRIVVLQASNGAKYVKFTWQTSGSNQLYFDVYAEQNTVDAALGDTSPVSANVLFTRVSGGIVPTYGLVAYYPFTGNANDAGGNGYNGQVTGASLTTDRFGNTSGAYYFNGGSDYIVFPDVPQNSSITLNAWFKSEYDLTGRKIVTFAGAGGICIGQNEYANHLMTYLETGYNDWNESYSTTTCNDNSWHMGTISYNGTEVHAFLDGQQYYHGSDTGEINYDANGLFVGKHWSGAYGYFKGAIDDIRLYNRALSQSEVQALYNE